MGSLEAQHLSPDTRSLLTRRREPCPEKVEGGQAEPPSPAWSRVNAAHVAPGAGLWLVRTTTSLPLPNAWGSMNLRRVSSWLPPIQRWMGVGGMGRDADQVSHPQGPAYKPIQSSTPSPISHPDEPPNSGHAALSLPEMDAETKGEVNRLWLNSVICKHLVPSELTLKCSAARPVPLGTPEER